MQPQEMEGVSIEILEDFDLLGHSNSTFDCLGNG